MSRAEYIERISHELKKVQITTQIELKPEELKTIIDQLIENDELIYCSHGSSRLEVFKLKENSESMMQISSKGKVIITTKSPKDYKKLIHALYNAVWFAGFSSYVIASYKVKIYRVEEYKVQDTDDVASLLLAQTILGTKKE